MATAAFDLEVGSIPADVFAVNPDPVIDVCTVGHGQHRVVVVDGFYRYPERVLELVDTLQFRDDPRGEVALPLRRGNAPADLSHLVPILRAYARQDNLVNSDAMSFVVQGMWGNSPLTARQRVPHNDPTAAALVYLNRPRDCSGGTGLYRHRPTGLELVPLRADARMVELARDLGYPPCRLNRRTRSYVEMLKRVVYDPRQANRDGSMLNDGNEHWELMKLVEMRFNRLVAYDGRIPHTVYLEPGSFEDVPRLVQMLGIEFDENVW